MKVDNRIVHYDISNKFSNTASDAVDANRPPEGQKPAARETSDTIVNLSTMSREVQLAQKVIAAEADVREEKVAAIKASIESGNYEVDPAKIADRLVEQSLEDLF